MSRAARGAPLAAGALVLLLAACARAPARPNLVLISIDTLRPDHLGAYGYARATSPAIDALAREGVVFERAYSTSNWTLPAHVSMLTGLYPHAHGVYRFLQRIGDDVELLPEALAALGYRSAGVVSAVPFLTAARGFARGWQVYDDTTAYPAPGSPYHQGSSPRPDTVHHLMVTSELVHRRSVELLDLLDDGPFFLFLHYFDVHDRYRPPPPYDSMFSAEQDARAGRRAAIEPRGPAADRAHAERLAALYDGEIRWVDSWLERLFAELERRRLAERTMVVVTGDHGEEFLEHGELHHGTNLYDTSVRVPLIVRFAGRAHAGRRVDHPVSLVDLGATLLAAAGSGKESWHSGRDLAGLLTRGPDRAWRERDLLMLGKSPDGWLAGLVGGGRKVVGPAGGGGRPKGSELTVFELAGDPKEARPRRPGPRAARQLRARLLEAWKRDRALGGRLAPVDVPARPGEVEALRALGYL